MDRLTPLFQHIQCKTVSEFTERISPVGEYFKAFGKSQLWLFRGVGSASFKLIPYGLREEGRKILISISKDDVCKGFDTKSNAVQWLIEARAIGEFFTRADEAGLPFPEDSQQTRMRLYSCLEYFHSWANAAQPGARKPQAILVDDPNHWIPYELLSFVAIAQHHRIPTRLLDWSYSPFIAAYFAAESALDCAGDDLAVYAIYMGVTNRPSGYEALFRKFDLLLIQVSVPRAANPNLHAQAGIFTYLERRKTLQFDDWQPFAIDDVASDPDYLALDGIPLLYKFTLPRSLAPELLSYLDKLGVNAARLFPGYDGAAKAVLANARV